MSKTLKELTKQHLIPRTILLKRMAHKKLTLAQVIKEFENPSVESRIGIDISAPAERVPRSVLMAHVEETYGIPLAELVQHWADLGYRRKPIAHWLGTSADGLTAVFSSDKIKIKWKIDPDLDGRGRKAVYICDGTPMSITEFSNRYGFQPGTLTERWYKWTNKRISEEMTKIARKRGSKSPTRQFLTMRLV